jgi:hypothetical protein
MRYTNTFAFIVTINVYIRRILLMRASHSSHVALIEMASITVVKIQANRKCSLYLITKRLDTVEPVTFQQFV